MKRDLEVARLRRALALSVEPIAGGWRVSGGSQPRDVVELDGRLCCGCEDQVFHSDLICKHLVAAVLRQRLGATLYAAIQAATQEGA